MTSFHLAQLFSAPTEMITKILLLVPVAKELEGDGKAGSNVVNYYI